MIHATELTRTFGPTRAVRGVSFEIGAGEIVGLLGPNGAGKTTTIRMLTGYLPPTSGRARIDGLDPIDDSHAVRSRIGYLAESNPIYPEMRVESYLRFRATLHGVPRARREGAVGEAIERCSLREMRRVRVGRLSKGYRQRVGLAAALVHDPKVLILDEPTSGLDPTQIVETRRFLRELAGRHTLLLSSHILSEVEKLCGRIIVFAHGQVRADGTPRAISAAPGDAGAYTVEAATTPERLDSALTRVRGAASVRTEAVDARWSRAHIVAEDGAGDLRESLGAALAGEGVALRELRREEASLERAFARLVEADPAEGSLTP